MTVFRRTAETLISPLETRLSVELAEHLRMAAGLTVSDSERRSWDRSLPIVANDLVEAGLSQVEMLIEYQLPLTSKRVDVVLAGTDRRTGGDAYVVVELKQWSHAEVWDEDSSRVLVHSMSGRPKLHPVLQARGYCDYLEGFAAALAGHPEALHGVAYLHNASRLDVIDLYDLVGDNRTRLFTQDTRGAFVDYLRDRFAPSPGRGAADRLLASAVRPSRQLLAHAAAELKEREQFVLLDEQRLAYELVLHAVDKGRRQDTKTVVVVSGGPGSGKSVIALSLLGELSRQGRAVLHATGSRSFTQTMRRVVGKGSTRLQGLFKYFNNFQEAKKNDLDVLICDESHRIREVSADRYTPARLRTGRPQVDELVDAALVPVFLLDEHQVVRPGEIGSLAEIREHAEARGLEVRHVSLDAQFRCGGSRRYEQWVLDLLGLDGAEPGPWLGDDHFEVGPADSPAELEALLKSRLDNGFSARMTAGYCWPWSDLSRDGTLVADVVIGPWARPWNVKGDRSVGDAPASALWATLPGGFGQVGCVYTAQGFEYDWNGVIIGPDLVYRDGRLRTDRSASKDPALRRGVSDQDADRLIRNTYKVLLTRGMLGTLVYSVDPPTQDYLARLLTPAS